MRKFDDKTGWDTARASVLFTVAGLGASGNHASLASKLSKQLTKWEKIDAERRKAEDALVHANARVAYDDLELDRAVGQVRNELLYECGGDRMHATFRAFFPTTPSSVRRMALEAEIETCERMLAARGTVKISKRAQNALSSLEQAMMQGRKSLAKRAAAETKLAEVRAEMTKWKRETDQLRAEVHVALEAWALEHGLKRDYARAFFPEPAAKKRTKATEAPKPAD